MRTQILKKLTKFPIEVKVLPSMDNIMNGGVSIDNIKHVEVADILGRRPVPPKRELLIEILRIKIFSLQVLEVVLDLS